MKKENFVTLLMSIIGGVLFALGMCMCLVSEWNAFGAGIVIGLVGVIVLAAMVAVRRKMLGLPPIRFTGKQLASFALALAGTLVFGLGMCMTMVWEGMLVWGIIVGLIGMVLLLMLIPLCRGLK